MARLLIIILSVLTVHFVQSAESAVRNDVKKVQPVVSEKGAAQMPKKQDPVPPVVVSTPCGGCLGYEYREPQDSGSVCLTDRSLGSEFSDCP